MLYLEDYLELIEHLPQELRDRLTLIRENDLKVNNSSLHIDTKVKQFFVEAKKLEPGKRQCNYENILKDYEETLKHADDKVQIASQTHEIMIKLIEKLDGEIEKFKLELEADHAGITEELERRSLELDAETKLSDTINGYIGNGHQRHSLGLKDRRRSEHKQRHQPYQIKHHGNGYQVRAKLAQNHNEHDYIVPNPSNHRPSAHHYQNRQVNGRIGYNNINSHQNSAATSPSLYGSGLTSSDAPASGDHMSRHGANIDVQHTSVDSFTSNQCFTSSYRDSSTPFNHQNSALSAALSTANTHSPQTLAMMNSSLVHKNKISSGDISLNGIDLTDSGNSLFGQNPIAAAASQAIAATQQMQQGRRTPSLKASFAAINGGRQAHQMGQLGSGSKQDILAGLANRNALAPMVPDQQAFRYSQQFGKLNTNASSNGNSNPSYVSVTKSGRPSKRPKHRASHLYPDESPTSISPDNSVFENSESLSSADFTGTSPLFSSASPSSLDYNGSRVSDQGSTVYYQKDDTRYCHCRQVSHGGMVACDNEECEIEWFHYGCVGITQPPEGKWYCPDCSSKMSSRPSSQAQPQKKRGRKEKSLFNMMNNSIETIQVNSRDRASADQLKGIV